MIKVLIGYVVIGIVIAVIRSAYLWEKVEKPLAAADYKYVALKTAGVVLGWPKYVWEKIKTLLGILANNVD